ncbi:MAG: hypothetical protein FWE98_05410 [Oscillospiraceae bacterium]|nr:hypothetical protein [Oscillospiraceae bacterium]
MFSTTTPSAIQPAQTAHTAGVFTKRVGNSIDSANGESSEFTPFLNIMSEWYARDASRSGMNSLHRFYTQLRFIFTFSLYDLPIIINLEERS